VQGELAVEGLLQGLVQAAPGDAAEAVAAAAVEGEEADYLILKRLALPRSFG